MTLHPSAKYIGIPKRDKGRSFDGVDCWGLVYLVLRQEFGIEIPSYADAYVSLDEKREIAALIEREKSEPLWEKVIVPTWGDIINFTRPGGIGHVGLFIDKTWMLHVEGNDASRLARWDQTPWVKRVSGFYRWCG